MSVDDVFDRLADAELARHGGDFRYEDVQLRKRGKYEIVARRIRKRRVVPLCICAAAAVLHWLLSTAPFVGIFWAIFALMAFGEYVNARRTEQIIRRLREERDRHAREARRDGRPAVPSA